MSNVAKLPGMPQTPRELIDSHAEAIGNASSIAVVIRNAEGSLTTLWSQQPTSQLLFSTEALLHDVRQVCFGGEK